MFKTGMMTGNFWRVVNLKEFISDMICRIFNCKEALVNNEKKFEDSYKDFAFDIEIVNNLIVENQNLRLLLEKVEPKVDCKFWRFYRYDDFMFSF